MSLTCLGFTYFSFTILIEKLLPEPATGKASSPVSFRQDVLVNTEKMTSRETRSTAIHLGRLRTSLNATMLEAALSFAQNTGRV